jgi:hypothetical protein
MENDDKKTFVFSIVKNQIESVKIFEQAFKDIQNALKDEDIKKA